MKTNCNDHGSCPSIALKDTELMEYKVKINKNWQLIDTEPKQLVRDFEFDTYLAGLDFANQVAQIAEELNHHPNMILGFKKVRVEYYTHNAGGLTEMDFDAAARIDLLLA
ncbi:MAG: 4a-hydroxytetrahydrobiopterin dehydratase [Cyanobacteria bacterium]|nr:4a-hydroxytetrahydrobiopterin dehydratase [Cyanobacteriota bacterium]